MYLPFPYLFLQADAAYRYRQRKKEQRSASADTPAPPRRRRGPGRPPMLSPSLSPASSQDRRSVSSRAGSAERSVSSRAGSAERTSSDARRPTPAAHRESRTSGERPSSSARRQLSLSVEEIDPPSSPSRRQPVESRETSGLIHRRPEIFGSPSTPEASDPEVS